MNEKDETKARIAADSLIMKILETQPEFLKVGTLDKESGKASGEFISALRSSLMEMYQRTPN